MQWPINWLQARPESRFGAATFKEGCKRVVNNHTDFASSRLRVREKEVGTRSREEGDEEGLTRSREEGEEEGLTRSREGREEGEEEGLTRSREGREEGTNGMNIEATSALVVDSACPLHVDLGPGLLESVEHLAPVHGKQLLTYLRLMQLPLGLLISFGAATFKEGCKRVVNNHTDFASPRLRVREKEVGTRSREGPIDGFQGTGADYYRGTMRR